MMFNRHNIRSILCFALVVVTSINAQETTRWNTDYRLDYNYDPSSEKGPQFWNDINVDGSEWEQYENAQDHQLNLRGNFCGNAGRRQSPLNLFADGECGDFQEILTRQRDDGDCGKDSVEFEILPNSLRAYFPADDKNCLRPTIVMNRFEFDWILAWMEMHVRAEHVVDGRRYNAELQLMHLGTGDNNHQVAFVSVLIEASALKENAQFQYLLDQWQLVSNDFDEECAKNGRIRHRHLDTRRYEQQRHANVDTKDRVETAEEKRDRVYDGSSKRQLQGDCVPDAIGAGCEPLGPRKRMFPYDMWPTIYYYRYRGAFTTPPCTDIAHWRILDEPLRISRRQFKQLAKLIASYRNEKCEPDSDVSPSGENFRPLQVINEDRQSVSHCTYANFPPTLYEPDKQ